MPGEWELKFCAGYIVRPGYGLKLEAIRERTTGSVVDVDSLPLSFFQPLFAERAEKCPIDVTFAPEGGKQQNAVRDLVRSVALSDPIQKEEASQSLAHRLAAVTTRRSPPGLLVILVSRRMGRVRVLLWKFPADESLQAIVSRQGITIVLLEDAFSRSSDYFKAAMFEGTPATTSFWQGKVEDKQATQRVTEAAKFWTSGFLKARSALTDTRGTKLLARGLKQAIKRTRSIDEKETLISAATVIKEQVDRDISLGDFADNYLPVESRPSFLESVGGPEVSQATFRIDRSVMENELRLKSIVLDGSFTIRGPLDDFDDVVRVEPEPQSDIVKISLRGKITAETIMTK